MLLPVMHQHGRSVLSPSDVESKRFRREPARLSGIRKSLAQFHTRFEPVASYGLRSLNSFFCAAARLSKTA